MTTFLLLHGIPGSAAVWEPVSASLGRHHDVLAPDLIGFGTNRVVSVDRPEPLLASAQAAHLRSVLERDDRKDVIVVGHDFGGPIAAHLVDAAPQRVVGLALFATNAFPDTPIPFPLSSLNLPLVGGLAERLLFSKPSLTMMMRQGVGRPALRLDVDRYLGDRSQQAAIATIFGASLRRLRELYAPVEVALRATRVPTLVGWGTRDPFFPVAVGRRTAALIADARFRVYDDAGHFLPEERPDQLAADLLELATLVSSS